MLRRPQLSCCGNRMDCQVIHAIYTSYENIAGALSGVYVLTRIAHKSFAGSSDNWKRTAGYSAIVIAMTAVQFKFG